MCDALDQHERLYLRDVLGAKLDAIRSVHYSDATRTFRIAALRKALEALDA